MDSLGFTLGDTWNKPWNPNDPFSLEYLGSLPPDQRMLYVRDHEAELEALDTRALDEVGLRLVAASPRELREEYPVLRERMDAWFGFEMSGQEKFEETIIPDGLTPGYHEDEEDDE